MPIQVDKKLLGRQYQHPNYYVEYYLYHVDGEEVTIPDSMEGLKKSSGACFSAFPFALVDHDYNRLAYLPKPTYLSVEKQRRWIELSVQWKLLPPYVKPEHLNKIFVIRFDNISPSLLYTYLCQIRAMEEFPHICELAMYLVEEHKVNPYLAIAAGSKVGCTNNGHFYLDNGGYTSNYSSAGQVNIKINTAQALQRYIKNPAKYDDRICAPNLRWGCQSYIQLAAKGLPDQNVRMIDFCNPEVIQAMDDGNKDRLIEVHRKKVEEERAAARKLEEEKKAAARKLEEEKKAAARAKFAAQQAEAQSLMKWVAAQVSQMSYYSGN